MSYIKETKATIMLVVKAWIYACFMNLVVWLFWKILAILEPNWFFVLVNIGLGWFVGSWLISRCKIRFPKAVYWLVRFITVGCTTLNIINFFMVSPLLTRNVFDYFILWFLFSGK